MMTTDIAALEAMAARWEADLSKLPRLGLTYESLSNAIADLAEDIADMKDEETTT